MKLSTKQKEITTKKLLDYGFYEFQILNLLQGRKINTNFGNAQLKNHHQLNVYTQYNDSTTVYNL